MKKHSLLYSLFIGFCFCLVLVSSVIFLPIPTIARLFGAEKFVNRYMERVTRGVLVWLLGMGGVKVKLQGLENLPESTERVCFVSNHQSNADYPAIRRGVPMMIGSISKKELYRLPFAGWWLWLANCIGLDRKNPRKAIKSINKGAENIKKGRPMIIFPEGTRSKGNQMNPFKRGSMKMIVRAEALVVPVTVDGSYRALEEYNRVAPCEITVTVHPPVDVAEMDEDERKQLHSQLWNTINSGLAVPGEIPPEHQIG